MADYNMIPPSSTQTTKNATLLSVDDTEVRLQIPPLSQSNISTKVHYNIASHSCLDIFLYNLKY